MSFEYDRLLFQCMIGSVLKQAKFNPKQLLPRSALASTSTKS